MVNKRIRELREETGLPATVVANRTGIDYFRLTRLERGKGFVEPEELKILKDFYGTTYEYLIEGVK